MGVTPQIVHNGQRAIDLIKRYDFDIGKQKAIRFFLVSKGICFFCDVAAFCWSIFHFGILIWL